MPVPCGTPPTHGQAAKNKLLPLVGSAVAERSEVRDESDKPEEQGNRAIRRNGENAPNERTAEWRPDAHGAGVREHVIRHPRAADVDERKNSSAGHGEERHGFREAVDGSAPLLIEQKENGGNQRAGVADTDPPDKDNDN